MIEFEFFNPSNWNMNCFEFPQVCRHVRNTSLMISDTGCHRKARDRFSRAGAHPRDESTDGVRWQRCSAVDDGCTLASGDPVYSCSSRRERERGGGEALANLERKEKWCSEVVQ
jgi:hypothetical protein